MRISREWYLILQVIREKNEGRYTLNADRTLYLYICYVLARNGVNTGFIFSNGTYGPFSPQVKESITAFANANLIVEKKLGRMVSLSVVEDVKIYPNDFTPEERKAKKKRWICLDG